MGMAAVVRNGLGVLQGQGRSRTLAEEDAAKAGRAGLDEEEVGAQGLDGLGYGGLRTAANGHEGDDGGHAYDDAQYGEAGAELTGPEGRQGGSCGVQGFI